MSWTERSVETAEIAFQNAPQDVFQISGLGEVAYRILIYGLGVKACTRESQTDTTIQH
jgi:hypothetical protein